MRLIDADAMMRKAVEKFYITNYFSHISAMIEDSPTIDAEPVVRCKECTYSETDDMGFYYCVHGIIGGYGVAFDADTFCSYGERKDNG